MFLYNSVLTFYLIKMKTIYTLIFILTFSSVYSQQKKINNYKYLIVPERFSFLKKTDQYQTSSLTKFLFKKNGFNVMLDSEELPLELKNDPCKALKIIIQDKSSMFKTAVLIELRDCFNKVLYTSKEGGSRIKDYKKSYQEAIRRAHASMSNFVYEPSLEVAISNNNEILESTNNKKVIVKNDVEKEVTDIKPVVKIDNTVTKIKNKVKKETLSKVTNTIKTLYAQPKSNGFQLINLKPEVVFIILNSKVKDVFIIKDKNGIFYSKDNLWMAEYYENEKLVQEKYQVKF